MSYSVNDAKIALKEIPRTISLYDRMLRVAAIITRLMNEYVKETDMPIIVGGLSMEIYTDSEYTTHDIDFVTSASIILEGKLIELGFERIERIFYYEPLNISVDIVDSALEPANYDGVIKYELDNGGYVFLQSIESILYDRVLDYERRDNQEYSIFLIANRYDEIDFGYLKCEVRAADPDALLALES